MNFSEMHNLLNTVLRERLDNNPSLSVKLLKQRRGSAKGISPIFYKTNGASPTEWQTGS
jgi:hypothetical protein